MEHILRNRRTFLVNSAALIVVANMAAACGECSTGVGKSLEELRAQLKQAVGGSEEALDFGRIYLADHPESTEREVLMASIAESVKPFAPLNQTVIQKAVEADYASSRVVSIAGWQVSDLEAKIYAVLYLEAQS